MSGGQIGGIIGGGIGYLIGGPLGAQIGYALGAGVGAYVDPVRTYGPRINDASAQTSSVGGVIPFGFGTFTTAGNLIWRDQLKEHAKTQRQGKGGGAKTTTYTYTRSYAIGICRGPIYGIKWIKRNGKKVYTTDPAATQEEKQASAKFAAKLSIYLGTETQLPDSTITAVEGMGNVNAHRGLAYVVVEHDDLTDLGGAVPQYEFCVQATPPEAYLTSTLYPQAAADAAQIRYSVGRGELRELVRYAHTAEAAALAYSVGRGELKAPLIQQLVADSAAVSFAVGRGVLKAPLVATAQAEAAAVTYAPGRGELRPALLEMEITSTATVNYSIGRGNLHVG